MDPLLFNPLTVFGLYMTKQTSIIDVWHAPLLAKQKDGLILKPNFSMTELCVTRSVIPQFLYIYPFHKVINSRSLSTDIKGTFSV